MFRVVVAGAAGRMGQAVVGAVGAEPDMEVVARADPALSGEPGCHASLEEALAAADADVLVDFTQPAVVFGNARAALAAGVHAVVGTTGLTDAQVEELRSAE